MPRAELCRTCVYLRFAALAVCAGAILWLSLMPGPPELPGAFLGWDKAQHAFAYAVLTWAAGRAFALVIRPAGRAWLAALVFSIVYGALIEIAQGALTRVRLADSADLLADALGASVVYLLARLRLFKAASDHGESR